MGRTPQKSSKAEFNKGAWTSIEDKMLTDYVSLNGQGKWSSVAKKTGLKRCGKSCRLRWLNYLRPEIKRGNITHDEEELIVRLHKLLGNRWSLIAGRLPGRTDNEIKNYWNSTLAKKVQHLGISLPNLKTNHQLLTAAPTPIPIPTPGSGCNPEGTDQPPTWPSGDHEINLPDFNIEDFCHILDAHVEENYWDGNYKSDDQLMNGSDFMSLVPFLDSDQLLDLSELA